MTMRPRSSAATTPSTMDSTSAAVSACSRRSSSKRSASCRCICRSAWTSASMSGTPERGKRGGDPAAIARAAAVIWVNGLAIERPATSASRAPTSSASSAAPTTAACARRTISSTCRRSAATRIAPGPPGRATYSMARPTVSLWRVAMPVRPASASRISGRSR